MKQIKKGTRVRVTGIDLEKVDYTGEYIELNGHPFYPSLKFHFVKLDPQFNYFGMADVMIKDEDIEVISELKKGMPVIAEDNTEKMEGFFHSEDDFAIFPINIVYKRENCFVPIEKLTTQDYEVFDPEDVKPKFNPGDVVYEKHLTSNWMRNRYKHYDDQNGSLCHCIGSNMFSIWVSNDEILTEAEYRNMKNQQEDLPTYGFTNVNPETYKIFDLETEWDKAIAALKLPVKTKHTINIYKDMAGDLFSGQVDPKNEKVHHSYILVTTLEFETED